jgi:PTS system nitrogen regulatory IIA component
MSVQHCFEPGTVIPDLTSTDKVDALREIIRGAPVFREIHDTATLEESVMARERLQSTGLGHGVAVAHGRSAGLKRVLIALGISRSGLSWESPDAEPVRLIFLIASPLHVSLDYLQALSTVVRCVRDSSVRESLLSSRDAAEVHALMRETFCAGLERTAGSFSARGPCSSAG